MKESKALVPKPTLSIAELEERAKRRELRAQRRQAQLRQFLDSIAFDSVHDVNLRKHAGKTDAQLDEEIKAGRMTLEDAWKVKEWQKPKKSIAYAIEAANQHVTTVLKQQGEKGGAQVNVGTLVVNLPEKASEGLPEPIYMDVEAAK